MVSVSGCLVRLTVNTTTQRFDARSRLRVQDVSYQGTAKLHAEFDYDMLDRWLSRENLIEYGNELVCHRAA